MLPELPNKKSTPTPSSGGFLNELLDLSDEGFLAFAQSVRTDLLSWPLAERAGVNVFVRRDDLIDPVISGNKLYKLWGHLQHYIGSGCYRGIVSFGGAYSNHLHALASACQCLDIPLYAFIRGEKPRTPSPTLLDLERCGTQLIYLSRQRYREKMHPDFQRQVASDFGLCVNAYWISEGGGGELGSKGCELLGRHLATTDYDYILQACGTGTTLAGLAKGLTAVSGCTEKKKTLLGVAALRSDQDIVTKLNQVLAEGKGAAELNWGLTNQYHCGGFARSSNELREFTFEFEQQTGLSVDKVYTCKVFYGLQHMINNCMFTEGSRVLVIHSGGLQGNRTI